MTSGDAGEISVRGGLLAGLDAACLIGPTATGKSALALAICERTGAEIVSLDSMQVYRGMDVGTAKASAEERERVPHHMLDLVPPSERYDVRRYLDDLRQVADGLRARRARVLFVGGTGFYLKALLHGIFEGPPVDLALRARIEARVKERGHSHEHEALARADPRSALRIHANDTKRLVRALEVLEQTGRPLSDWQREWGWHGQGEPAAAVPIVGLEAPDEELDRRIEARAREMIDKDLAGEAELIRSTWGFGPTASQALGYAEALSLADGAIDRETCIRAIAQRTRRFARRQRTWYRKFEGVRWLPASGAPERALGVLPWAC
ncbi:MAG: tRNA (adenosine(37)-N6)-dimethylallyltransferase MiaA [Planctomycetota bacterium]